MDKHTQIMYLNKITLINKERGRKKGKKCDFIRHINQENLFGQGDEGGKEETMLKGGFNHTLFMAVCKHGGLRCRLYTHINNRHDIDGSKAK